MFTFQRNGSQVLEEDILDRKSDFKKGLLSFQKYPYIYGHICICIFILTHHTFERGESTYNVSKINALRKRRGGKSFSLNRDN